MVEDSDVSPSFSILRSMQRAKRGMSSVDKGPASSFCTPGICKSSPWTLCVTVRYKNSRVIFHLRVHTRGKGAHTFDRRDAIGMHDLAPIPQHKRDHINQHNERHNF